MPNKKIKIADLLNPNKFNHHKDDLLNYFEKGGTWQEFLGYDHNLLDAQHQIAFQFYQQADYKKAASAYSYLTVLNPYEYKFWMGLAISKQSDRLYEEAIVGFTMAEAIDPENPTPHLHLAQCYQALQLRDLVLRHLKKTVEVAGTRFEFAEIRKKAEILLNHFSK